MKKYILTLIILQLISYYIVAQTDGYYYVKSTMFLNQDRSDSTTSISYMDAYGRAKQSIVLNASPTGKNIVQTFQYDELGRPTKSYLPFTEIGGQNGEFIDEALDLQASFWQSQNIAGGDIPYATVEYDNSPYNRIIKQSAPGEDIANVNVSSDYIPAGIEVSYWYVNTVDALIHNGSYADKSLMKFTAKDADNKETYIYKDKSGKLLLKEQDLNGVSVKTRFVYDTYGRLRYVMSPEAVNRMTATSYNKDDTDVKQYCYYYDYNDKHQLITKQLPGKEQIYLRYDDLYRLRMTQDGNQRLDDKWMFINYDNLGRTVSTGLGTIDETLPIPEKIIPPNNNGITPFLTHQYYDNYDFAATDPNLQFDSDFAYHDKFNRIRGKATGSKTRVMSEDSEEWLTFVVYYDKRGRVIQSITKNNVGGYDIVSHEYNFAGQVLESKHKHTNTIKETKYLIYLYTYDAMGRLLKTELSQNADSSSAVIINEITYNELGQVETKDIHSENGTDFLQTVDYLYNIKGAITDINKPDDLGNDLFGMKLYYDEGIEGMYQPNTYEDGKISAIQWNSAKLEDVKTYMYTYDNLNRLTQASYSPGSKYSVHYEYDLNGNITHLERAGEIIIKSKASIGEPPNTTQINDLIDDLTYTYNGNRLTNVSDLIGEVESQLNNDFKDSKNEGQEYFYDANGNMVSDKNKAIDNITYNHLNQPVEVKMSDGKITQYTYTATGGMLKTKIYEDDKLKTTTEYSGAYVYENNTISYINIPGGRIIAKTQEYQYNLTDHLGNVRVTFGKDKDDKAVILQEDHYYPFGMRMNGQHFSNTDLLNKFLYNGKELQDQTGMYDYGFRQLDPQLGRWHVIDAMAERYMSTSPYAYTTNDPISHIDVAGLYSNNIKYHRSNGDDSDYIYSGGYLNKILGLGSSHHYNPHRNIGKNFEDYWTEIEGTWVHNSAITTINIIEVIQVAAEGGLEGNLVLTFIPVGDDFIPVMSVGELGSVIIDDGSLMSLNKTAAQFIGEVDVTQKYINWGEVGSSAAGLLLGAVEVAVGIAGEIPTGGVSTTLIVDGGVRIASNATKIYMALSGNSNLAVATPSNLGGWGGKGIDLALGTPYTQISYGQGIGSFTNDIATMLLMGGNAANIVKMQNYPSAYNITNTIYTYTATPYTISSDFSNWQNNKP